MVGFGESGPGNHESVGYDGFKHNLQPGSEQCPGTRRDLNPRQISGAGFGIAGYDWPIETAPMLEVITTLGLTGPVELVNDVRVGVYWPALPAAGAWRWSRAPAAIAAAGMNRGSIADGSPAVALEFGEFAGASELMYHGHTRHCL